jgi:DNA-binding NarL/FixJ family response regulator
VTNGARILLVEDFEPALRYEASLLQENPEWQIIGEATDGLEAVLKAEELRPDLILLDIGLPKLNGIEAARQIRRIIPESRLIFVSQESSSNVVAEALNIGARGYVLKMRAGSDLLAAVQAVLEGGQFVSRGLIAGRTEL